MLYMDGLIGLVTLALWIFCLIDVITTEESLCRNLGKTLWLLLVLLLPLVGSIAWLVAGRPQPQVSMPYKGNVGPVFPDHDRPRHPSLGNPDDDESYRDRLRERAEQQRQAYRESKRRELEEGGSSATDAGV